MFIRGLVRRKTLAQSHITNILDTSKKIEQWRFYSDYEATDHCFFPLSLMLEVEMGVVPPGLANLYLNEHSSQNCLKHNMLRLALLFLTWMVKFLITLFRSNYLLIRFFFLILLSQLACCYCILSNFVFCLCLFFLPCRRLLTADYCSSAWPESLPPPACWLRGLASFNRTPDSVYQRTFMIFKAPIISSNKTTENPSSQCSSLLTHSWAATGKK